MKIRTRYLFCAIVMVLMNCTNAERNPNKVHSKDSLIKRPDTLSNLAKTDSTSVGLKDVSQASLRVVKIENKAILRDSTSEYREACLKWQLNEKQVIQIFGYSERISGSEMHDLYYDLPCRINGQIEINGILYNFIVNGGSFIYLYDAHEKLYLGCSDERCKEFFLVQGGDLKRDVPDY